MLHFYHPNKSIKGFACSFWYSKRDESLFATLIKQSGWDSTNQNGTFKESLNDPLKKINIKLDFVEAAAIVDCVERNRPFSSFHDNEQAPKSIKFEPWMGDEKQRGFSFSVTVTNKEDREFKNPFYIGLTFAEARLIREYILHVMHIYFDSRERNRPAAQTQQASDVPTEPQTSDEAKEAKDPLVDF